MSRLFKQFFILCAAALLTSVATACKSDKSSRAVPRPDAWPRIEVPEAEYVEQAYSGVNLAINRSAQVEMKDANEGLWLDVSYPEFPGSVIYLSVSNLKDEEGLRAAIANRRQRMELNAGGATTELTELSSEGGWTAELALTRSSLTTPLQFLAHDGKKRLISGALYLNYPSETSSDSVAPIVRAVNRDIERMLQSLRSIN